VDTDGDVPPEEKRKREGLSNERRKRECKACGMREKKCGLERMISDVEDKETSKDEDNAS
jgi:hypothetical protein